MWGLKLMMTGERLCVRIKQKENKVYPVLALMSDFYVPDVNWEYHIVATSRSRKFLKYVDNNFLVQLLRKPAGKDLP